ncbi:hypothetical protein MM221_15765 [Salipaludibacillus sp. LMS25]|jgi:hypothetical protein|uniref:hypothetical protein n=1 Tax=Salipaludibacillus sp. LMS25 TaxID=2924031 RepID=UPI0020D131A1|nr:hypothetical protein [Salipaludibacillus sp. LMS25]UTR14051.1 hypothetical protein MM221_15765 [Salipaludibacillus sp. LMS25]
MKTYIYPICGYDGIDAPPYEMDNNSASYDSCPCCYFEYGYSEDHEVDLGYIVTPVDMRGQLFTYTENSGLKKVR